MSTVTRVLPWKRQSASRLSDAAPLFDWYREHRPKARMDLVERAYAVAAQAHEGQLRKSGEPYITHPVAVARIVAGFGVDEATVCAALLHDTVEDCGVSLDEVEAGFGPDVAALVDGCTKLERFHFARRSEQQAETVRKIILATASDLRVIVIKLADRLHNLRTLAAMSPEAQDRIASETMAIYAPLAHRLGMSELRQQLEDLCFAAMQPKVYAAIDEMVAARAPGRKVYLAQVVDQIRDVLGTLRISAEVSGRPKHLWSIYQKMVVRGRPFEEMHDLMGVRVIVETVKDCYAAIGGIHRAFTPVAGRFKDYIATPKFNMYQSLHTTVVHPGGKTIEVQIRTSEMHRQAEHGVAAHYSYKEGSPGFGGRDRENMEWLARIVDWQRHLTDPDEFLRSLVADLSQDEVYVFTPKGEAITLPQGATPVDFAYSVHTQVGHACIGARVNGQLVPLDHRLAMGDSVEIFTSKLEGRGPQAEWLAFVKSRSAATKIKQFLARERRDGVIEAGEDHLERALRREGLGAVGDLRDGVLGEVAAGMGFHSVTGLLRAVGEDKLEAGSVVQKVSRQLRAVRPDGASATSTGILDRVRTGTGAGQVGIHVDGMGGAAISLADCCRAAPGDEITGLLREGSVEIHRADCAEIASPEGASSAPWPMVDVEWDTDTRGVLTARLVVRALDRPRLLSDVTACLADLQVDVSEFTARSGGDRISVIEVCMDLGEADALHHLMARLSALDSVFEVAVADPQTGVGPGDDGGVQLIEKGSSMSSGSDLKTAG